MKTIVAELDGLMALATQLNGTRGPGIRITAETWLGARDEIARAIARSVGRLRRELGIKDDVGRTSFAAKHRDTGLAAVRQSGRAIPIERRGRHFL